MIFRFLWYHINGGIAMNTKLLFVLLLVSGVILSCSASNPITAENPCDTASTSPATNTTSSTGSNEMLWGVYEGVISADRSSAELIPLRSAMFELNVVGFIENASPNNIRITNKQIVGPNRLDLTVEIRHPWPGHQEYTAFDVFGGVQFPVSELLELSDGLTGGSERMVSWHHNGDPQVLNPDGFNYGYNKTPLDGQPEWKWFIEGNLGGEVLYDHFSGITNVWAYRNFKCDDDRNIFNSYGSEQQTYELWLPEGEEVHFGYVVLAHWEPAVNTPVLNPEADFDMDANRSGPYRFEVLDISGPVSDSSDCEVLLRAYWHKKNWNSYIVPCTYYYDGNKWGNGTAMLTEAEVINEVGNYSDILLTLIRWPWEETRCPPGVYPHIVEVRQAHGGSNNHWNGFMVFEIEVED